MAGTDEEQKAEALRLLERVEKAAADIIAAVAKLRRLLNK
jgi:hypothetical protein